MHTFYPHQQKALAYATGRSRVFLAMEMRLGKTPVSIRWAHGEKLHRILVAAPLSTINPGWIEELRSEGVPNKHIHILTEVRKRDRQAVIETHDRGWFLINYEYLRTHPEMLDVLDVNDDGIIIDESTRIRSPKARITKMLLKHTQVEHRALLSGMPNPEGVMNWFEQMRFMNGEFLGYTNYWHMRNSMFRQPWPGSWEWKPKDGTMDAIKKEVHRHVFIMTAKKAGMANKHIYQKRLLPMNAVQRRLMKDITKNFAYKDVETKWVPVQQTWLKRIAGGFSPDGTELVSDAKLKELVVILKEDLPRTAQVVVWAHYRSEIRAIHQYLNAKKIPTAKITGSTSRRTRSVRQLKFRRGTYRVLVIQSKIGMYGLNLSAADTDVYYSNMWDNEVRTQCEKRTEHLTKKVPLLHIDLMTQNSVDEELVPRLREKKLTARSFNLIISNTIQKWRREFPADRFK